MPWLFGAIAAIFGLILLAILLTLVLVPVFRGIGWLVSHVFAFIGGEIKDTLRLVGAIVTATVFSLLVVANIMIFRWSASAHFGRAFSAELAAGGASIYRLLIGHPARLLGLTSLVDGIERRVPEAVAAAPTADRPSRRTGQFESYRIIGSLPGGGSGGKLYIAEPDDIKLAAFARNGQQDVEQVVIKSFSLQDGSSLPQIVRESRALDAAKKLGLVLDHELSPERFFYVMRYVPGEALGLVTQHLHAASPDSGLSNASLDKSLGYIERLLATLGRYHRGGLWHKDVKPDNIIIHGDDAHLVDFGLITPLRSAMTLTTHGTEYFRDPEMVRMALKGVKVHEVDGARFDVYATGAVLYSVVENQFPAHGGLSQITKRCPDAVRWIIRRAMTEYDKRYPTADAMLTDLAYVRRAPDPFAVKPAELPSVAGGAPMEPAEPLTPDEFAFVPPPVTPIPRREPAAPFAGPAGVAAVAALDPGRARPRLRVANWWSGRYELEDGAPGSAAALVEPLAGARVGARRSPSPRAGGARRPAAEQLRAARSRADARRTSARERLAGHRHGLRAGRRHASGVNAGVAASVFIFLIFCVAIAGALLTAASRSSSWATTVVDADAPEGLRVNVHAPKGGASVSVGATATPAITPVVTDLQLTGRVLVVSDLLPPLDERAGSMVQGWLSAMQAAGMDVLGNVPGITTADDQVQSADELSAQARSIRGLVPLNSADARNLLSRWLGENKGADLLVWIAPGDQKGGQPSVYVFGSPDLLRDAPADYLPSIQRLLSSPG